MRPESESSSLSASDLNWLRWFHWLIKFKRLHGNWPTATTKFPGHSRIGQWMYRNRQEYFQGKLSKFRFRKLEEAGCPLEPIRHVDQYWDHQFGLMLKFRRRNPGRWPYSQEEFPKGNRLGRWFHEQRFRHTRGTLKKFLRAKLKSIGFPFKPVTMHTDRWNRNFEALKSFRKSHTNRWPNRGILGRWCFSQRRRRVTGELSRERIRLLNQLGFEWNSKVAVWRRRLIELRDFIRRHEGKRPAFESRNSQERVLANWLAFQRSRNRRGLLEAERRSKLNRLGLRLPSTRNP